MSVLVSVYFMKNIWSVAFETAGKTKHDDDAMGLDGPHLAADHQPLLPPNKAAVE